ncbi:uncharacterized protein N7482_009781 [Penicillium canariense]|uniref:Uncharacterized protein n=1 Tax=Penicillium canariense TaxID=189055 RepID=A0A9W9HN54_9EURO|nr:uncharacterized protein N7482_009781 [Penicillium canariense]KAJ5153303.1 hypothetical protein N7482_009781 [Penicillium canariense]
MPFFKNLGIELEERSAVVDMAVDPVRKMFSSRTQQQRPFKGDSLVARQQTETSGMRLGRNGFERTSR